MYLGEKEVSKVEGTKVIFTDESSVELTEKQVAYMITEEPKDASEFRQIVLTNITTDVLGVLQAHNIKKGDLQKVLELVISSFNESLFIAMGKAFGTYEEGKSSIEFQENITIGDIIKMKDK